MTRLSAITLLLLCALTPPAATTAVAAGHWQAHRDSVVARITGAATPSHQVLITDFGARGDSLTDCLPAFRKAMDYAREKGGAHIKVPEGTWIVRGPIHFVSNVTLEIAPGATLKFVARPEYYLPMVPTSWEGTWLWNYSPFIYGYGLHDVTICGGGTIDSDSDNTFATWRKKQSRGQELSRQYNHEGRPVAERRFGEGFYLRPHMIQFYDCKGVTLTGVFLRRSPFWCVHLLQCENVVFSGLRYDAKLVNNDGIDIESSRDVLIDNVYFNNGDDNIAIKSGRDNDGWTTCRPSENIVIRRCHFKGLHAVVIGSEMSGGVENVFVENCDYAGYCKRGIFVKTNPDRGGYVKGLYVDNVAFGEVADLFYVTSMYAGQGLDNCHFSTIEQIHVSRLSAEKVTGTALVLQGTEEKPIRQVSFSGITVGEARNGVSFENTEPVQMSNCFIGLKVGVPSQISAKDNIFKR